jgi:hypothetical protein
VSLDRIDELHFCAASTVPSLFFAMSKEEENHLVDSIPESSVSSHHSLWSRRSHPTLSHYTATPISKHYEVNRQILLAFETSYAQNLHETAYTLGIIYVETALLEIPKHGYFYSSRHDRERMQSSLEAVRVTQRLNDMVDRGMVPVSDFDRVHLGRMAELALMQVQQASEDQFESQRAQTEIVVRKSVSGDSSVRLLDMGRRWSRDSVLDTHEPRRGANHSRSSLPNPSEQSRAPSRVTPTEATMEQCTRARTVEESRSIAERGPARGSPFFTLSTDSFLLDKALYLSGLELSCVPESDYQDLRRSGDVSLTDKQELQRGHTPPHWATISSLYREDFDYFRECGRIRVSYANTHQGRLPGSTNGCTVISPLLCIHHLLNDDHPDPGLPDSVIDDVIDAECPAILRELRGKLHLSSQALLIPSDAHDYLIDNGQLSREQFIAVIGGNVVDENHLKCFVDALENSSRRKVATCFYFHEHVVAILRVTRDNATWYDLIDSLPCASFKWTKDREQDRPFDDSVGMGDPGHTHRLNASRVRCLGLEALTVCLRWYACSRFSQDNLSFIDQYEWDEASSDFDPRVFQGFVWGSHD